jgi:hypothetical protein
MIYQKYRPGELKTEEVPFALLGDGARIERAWLMIGAPYAEVGSGRMLNEMANLHFVWTDSGGRPRVGVVILPHDMDVLDGTWRLTGALDVPTDEVVADWEAHVVAWRESLAESFGFMPLLLRFEGEARKVGQEIIQCMKDSMSEIFRPELERFDHPAG